jgi:hypothetical protein
LNSNFEFKWRGRALTSAGRIGFDIGWREREVVAPALMLQRLEPQRDAEGWAVKRDSE